MRPIERGESPFPNDFADYRDAFPFLVARIGPFCSYCERRIATLLAVEHILPKSLHPTLAGRWDNFLLGCVNCNSTKKDQDVRAVEVFLPDRDNTAAAFDYSPDGKVKPAAHLSGALLEIAKRTLALTGLDRKVSEALDENGKVVAIDRENQRKEAWGMALSSKIDFLDDDSPALRRQIVRTAQETGFFSIWMTVFSDAPEMRRLLLAGFTEANGAFVGFKGTSEDCFDLAGNPVSPRPANGLEGAGKI